MAIIGLTAAPGFPVLLGNAVDWLARPVLFASRSGDADLAHRVQRPGLTAFAGVVTKITGPGDSDVPLTRVGEMAFARLRAERQVQHDQVARTELATLFLRRGQDDKQVLVKRHGLPGIG